MTEPKRTSFMRYARTYEILKSDNALSKKLSKKMAAVCRTDQTHEDFPVEVIYVTDEIHKQGFDAHTMHKIDVLRLAHRLLIATPGPIPMPELPPLLPPPAKEKKPEAKPKSNSKPRSRPKPKPKPKPKLEPTRVRPRPKEEATGDRPAPVEPVITGIEGDGESASTLLPKALPHQFIRPYVPNVPGIAVMNCLYGAQQLLQPFVAVDPDAKELSQKLSDLIDEVSRRTVMPSNAETKPATSG
jgi:hypothetical protein